MKRYSLVAIASILIVLLLLSPHSIAKANTYETEYNEGLISFTIPAGWTKDTIDNHALYKIAITKDSDPPKKKAGVIMFGYGKLIDEIPRNYLVSAYKRDEKMSSKQNTDLFPDEMFAALFDSSVEHISRVSYNGINYVKNSDTIEGRKIEQYVTTIGPMLYIFTYFEYGEYGSYYHDYLEGILRSVKSYILETRKQNTILIVAATIVGIIIIGSYVYYLISKKKQQKNEVFTEMDSSSKDEKEMGSHTASPKQPLVEQQANSSSKYCRKCGKELPIDSEFCMFCGEKQS